MKNPAGVENPFVDNEGVDRRELRIREMKFPPEMRMSGPKQSLRDAYLGRMMLDDALPRHQVPGVAGMWHHAMRENGRIQLNQVIAELEQRLSSEDARKCREIAKQIFSWQMNERRIGR
jgi:hypothetical protein